MKKLFLLRLVAFLGLLCITACHDDKEDAKPKENPMAEILKDPSWTETKGNNGTYELGYSFASSVNGKITQLGCKMPNPGTYTVSLWEMASKKLLRQKTVEQSSPDKFILVNIEELPIEKDKKFVISINNTVGGKSTEYYIIKNGNSTIFPLVRGSILIQSLLEKFSPTSVFPTTTTTPGFIIGYSDFTFIPD